MNTATPPLIPNAFTCSSHRPACTQSRALSWLCGLASMSIVLSGCAARQVELLREDIADTRAADAKTSNLAEELDPESRARLEQLGRTSAPNRYAEKIDANKIRTVAFDFGGARLGQRADIAGNLMSDDCIGSGLEIGDHIQVGPWEAGAGEATPPANGGDPLELYKGMFKQYGRQVGTSVDLDAAVGPVGGELRAFTSHNFLVMEWRRYRLLQLDPGLCYEPHVSAIESGVAVRIVFDVRLTTHDAKLNASFGITDLAAALSRNEAKVEVSYQVVGTPLDLLPREGISISSLNEYLDAVEKFHAAVVRIRNAWHEYNDPDKRGRKIVVSVDGNDVKFDWDKIFVPDELAYHVQGAGAGDIFVHLENVETCQDLEIIEDYYKDQRDNLRADTAMLESRIERLDAELRKRTTLRARRQQIRSNLRTDRVRATDLRRKQKKSEQRYAAARMSFVKNDCQRTLEFETKRKVQACAAEELKPGSYLGLLICDDQKKTEIDLAKTKIQKVREYQESQQQGQQVQQGDAE